MGAKKKNGKAIRLINKTMRKFDVEMRFCNYMTDKTTVRAIRNEYGRGSLYCHDFLVALRNIKLSLQDTP